MYGTNFKGACIGNKTSERRVFVTAVSEHNVLWKRDTWELLIVEYHLTFYGGGVRYTPVTYDQDTGL